MQKLSFASAVHQTSATVLPAPRDKDLFPSTSVPRISFEAGGLLHKSSTQSLGRILVENVTVWNAKSYRCLSDSEVDNRVVPSAASEDDGFSQPMRTIFEDLGQSVFCQHQRCASGRKRPRTSLIVPETAALQTLCSSHALSTQSGHQGSKSKACQAKDGSIQ